MGVLRGFERRLEGAVEGMFARAFRSGLQPIELAQATQRYCKDHKQVTSRGVVAPNQYRFMLNPDDFERMEAYGSSLHRELGEVLRETCRDIDAAMYGQPTFGFEADDDIMLGRFEVTGRISTDDTAGHPAAGGDGDEVTQTRPSGAGEGGPPVPRPPTAPAVSPTPASTPIAAPVPIPPTPIPPTPIPPTSATSTPSTDDPADAPHATQAMPTAAATPPPTPAAAEMHTRSAPALHLEVLDTGATLVIRHGRHTIGRSTDCDLPIDSTTVSRKHAVLVERGDSWWVFDLGSTNGTRVNGTRASELQVRPGDRMRIGTVDLLVREA